MITLVKVNVLTDDVEIPSVLREKVTAFLREILADDIDVDASVSLEWKHTIHNHDYMRTLPPTNHVERIRKGPPKRTAAAPRKPVRVQPRKAVR